MHGHRTDPAEIGIYTIAEVSRFVGANPETVRRWAHGRRFTQRDGSRGATSPLLETPRNGLLCFYNLVEVYLIHVLRKGLEDELKLPMPRVRRCLENLRRIGGSERHPLARQRFLSDGITLYLDRVGELVDLQVPQQRLIQDYVRLQARRIEWDRSGVAVRYRIWTPAIADGIGNVVCSPRVGFGRPTIDGVATAVILERFNGGESPEQLADDYGLDVGKIIEAIRCESRAGAA